MSCRKCSSAWRGTRVRRRRRILARQPMGATASDAPGTHSQTSHSVHKRGRAYAESIDKTQRIFSSFLQHTFIVMRVWLGLVPGVSAQSTGHAVKSAVHCSFAQAGCGIAFFRTARCTVLRAKPFPAKSPRDFSSRPLSGHQHAIFWTVIFGNLVADSRSKDDVFELLRAYLNKGL